MSNVHRFTPRRSSSSTKPSPSPIDIRATIEEAAQAALDTVEWLIGILDRMDGNPDDEDGADAEPSLGAPEGHAGQIVWLRGSSSDHEQDGAGALS